MSSTVDSVVVSTSKGNLFMLTDEIRDCLLRLAFLSYFLARYADVKYFDEI